MTKISVVIPTLGGEGIKKTIRCLMDSSIVPSEVIICIPKKFYHLIDKKIESDVVQVIQTEVVGQVAQRAIGFNNAKHEYIIQLDDDVFLDHECIRQLLLTIVSNRKIAVGPKLYNLEDQYHSPRIKTKKNSIFNNFLFWIINGNQGYKPGKISKNGIAMGIEDSEKDEEVEWLSGACILHRNENIINFNFYPYKGKAYSEDIIHSILLRERNVSLIRSGKACCKVNLSSGINLSSIFQEFYSVVRIGLHISKNRMSFFNYTIYQILTYVSKCRFIFKKIL